MARRRKADDQTNGVGLNTRQVKRKKPINIDLIREIEPLTDNQETLFESYKSNKNVVAYGCAGTGKTFITLYNALRDVLDERTPYEKFILFVLWLQLVKSVFFLATMKISLHFIKFPIRIW